LEHGSRRRELSLQLGRCSGRRQVLIKFEGESGSDPLSPTLT
jgi:hypothetical protein